MTSSAGVGTAVRFLAVSALGYTVDLMLLLSLQAFGALPRTTDVTIAFWVTYGLNFGLHRVITFRAGGRALAGQMSRYLPQVMVDFTLTLGAVELLAGGFAVPLLVSRLIAAGTNLTFNYVTYRWWTFRHPPHTTGQSAEAPPAGTNDA